MVALLDAPDAMATRKITRFASERIRSFSTVFHKDQSIRFDQFLLGVVDKSLRKAKNASLYLVRKGIRDIRDRIRLRLLRFILDRSRRVPRFLEGISVQDICLFAESQYRPTGLLDGELLLFRATSGEAADEPFAQHYDDPLFGWGRRSKGGVRAIDVPGGHFSMLQEPNVGVLAEHMQLYLNQVLAGETKAPALCVAGHRAERHHDA
jgi:hypothetical protein